ncbi:MAG: hypothetical protein ACR2PH_16985, partial [Desulfobulbia bacterium]
MARLKKALATALFATMYVFFPTVGLDPLNPTQAASGGFSSYAGRWIGNGHIVFSDNKREKLKCRVTYFVGKSGNQLSQNIRCSSSSGV